MPRITAESTADRFQDVVEVQVVQTPAEIEIKVAVASGEIQSYFAIRRQVFVEEQQIFHETDVDGFDSVAIPILAMADGRPAGAVRCYPKRPGRACVWFGGRLAVHREHRTSCNIGALLVRKAVEVMEGRGDVKRFLATIQIQNVRFFKRLGWVCLGRPFMMNSRKHQMMEKPLRRISQ
jgi:putative N-acetyltransferase (TIGR04045 family)